MSKKNLIILVILGTLCLWLWSHSDSVVKTLLEKDLVTIKGREESPGRALLYGTTQSFLESFGLNKLTDLPKLKELTELLGEGNTPTTLFDATE